jgi:two-component sensor histidine kinase
VRPQYSVRLSIARGLAFIVSELAKYSEGSIGVRFETKSSSSHSLSVLDHGPGLPKGFDPSKSKGLGIKIVLSLAKQIGGELHVSPEMPVTAVTAFLEAGLLDHLPSGVMMQYFALLHQL